MLHFSFSTVLMTTLASNLLVGLIAVVFFHKKLLTSVGYKLLAFCVALVVFRLIVPFKFPFTATFLLPQISSKIAASIQEPKISVLDYHLSIWNVFEIIWIFGILLNLVRCYHNYNRTENYILKYGQDKTNDSKYRLILDQICRQYGKYNSFHVIELPCLNVPMIFGFKNPYIILPANLSIPSDKLYYVLYHEAMHHFHHSFLIKNLLRLIAIIYWWNPACILLCRQSYILQEMYIDSAITHNESDVIYEYSECLLYINQSAAEYSLRMSDFLNKEASSLISFKNSEFTKRMTILLQNSSLSRKICTSVILTVLTVSVYLTSHLLILEAAYDSPKLVQEESVLPSKDNSYFIQIDDLHYECYMNDTYYETITDFDGYPSGIKIYNREGELIDEI